jgi:hypothetical protein
MAELKTKPTKVSVASYVAAIKDPARRKDCKALVTLIGTATGLKPKMWGTSIVGFGAYHYKYASGHEGDSCVVGFSNRAGAISLYAMKFPGRDALLAKLGKHKAATGCIYVKSLDGLDTKVLAAIFKKAAASIKTRYGFIA